MKCRSSGGVLLKQYFLTLPAAILLLCGPLSAQTLDKDGQFYLGFAGSAVFPYDPSPLAVLSLKAGDGFTAAFGYTFKEGFSTEIEWGYQKVGIGDPSGLGGAIGAPVPVVSIGDGWTDSEGFPYLSTIKIDGEIKTQSLMGNFYYRYPEWRVSPYVGFGLGAFFHDRAVTSTTSFEPFPRRPDEFFLGLPGGPLTVTYEDSRFAYQIMGGLSVRVYTRVEFRVGYRFRSSRRAEIDADCIEGGIRFWI